MPTALYSHTGEDKDRIHLHIVRGDTDTSPTERHYLKSVEKGDYSSVQNFLEESAIYFNININCVDALGRTALIIAIENENMDIIELLLSYNVELGDALLFAIEEEVPQAVEVLLNYRVPKASKKDQMALMNGGKRQESNFTPDITPVILAAHTNNYEILKTLVGRGATIVKPHGVKCSCYECVHSATFDSLRHSQTRMNAYRALASPCLMILCSDDPFLTAFELSWELHHLSFGEVEFKEEYQKLSDQCSKFAVDLLDQTRGSQELKTILNRTKDPMVILEMEEKDDPENEKDSMNLSRFRLAIEYRQKEFVAHPNCQQLLSHMWYQGIPGWKQGNMGYKLGFTMLISLTFPFTSLLYICFPFSKSAAVLKNPFVKFINHSASYVCFLVLLVLASTDAFNNMEDHQARTRPPNIPEWLIIAYVFAFIWNEMKEIYESGFLVYSTDLWNIMDFIQNFLYLATITLRAVVYFGPDYNINRKEMNSGDPMLVAEGLFAVANISSTLRLLFLFTANSQLGPLQISLGRMIIDIVKFLFIFALVLVSFASGMNQLLYLEYRYTDVGKSVDGCTGVTCETQNNEFSSIYHSMISLFWTVMGTVDLSAVSVNEDHAFTEQMAMLMYLVYHIIAIVVLLNMLIAMMNLSYEQIVLKSDHEWKFSRSRLWMSYFDDGKTVPPPFNIIISPKSIYKFILKIRTLCVSDLQELKRRQNATKIQSKMRELERKYQDSMTNLTQRYVANLKKSQDYEPVTEDDLNEIKQDISAFRYEVIELLRRQNGEEGSTTNSRSGSGRRTAGRSTIKNKTIRKPVVANQNLGSIESQTSNDFVPNGTSRLKVKLKEETKDESENVFIQEEESETKGGKETKNSIFLPSFTTQYMQGNIQNTINTNLVNNNMLFKTEGETGLGYTLLPAYFDNQHEIFQEPFILIQSKENPNEFWVRKVSTEPEPEANATEKDHINTDTLFDSKGTTPSSTRRPSIVSMRSTSSRKSYSKVHEPILDEQTVESPGEDHKPQGVNDPKAENGSQHRTDSVVSELSKTFQNGSALRSSNLSKSGVNTLNEDESERKDQLISIPKPEFGKSKTDTVEFIKLTKIPDNTPENERQSKYPQGYTEYQGIKFLPPRNPKFTPIKLSESPKSLFELNSPQSERKDQK